VALFTDPASHAVHQAYTQAMRARQRLLQVEGTEAAGIGAYEQLMVQNGVELSNHRSRVVERLVDATRTAFDQVAPEAIRLSARHVLGGSVEQEEFARRLFELRRQDSRRSWAGFGPHRDDLVFELNGRSMRTDASQGQHRLLTLSLKIAELACIGEASGIHPLLLLDDVSSELDADRTDAFFDLLGQRRDQVFLTTTRPEMLPVYERRMGVAKVFEVASGRVFPGNS
jgi:DNA replication and repair protein RecF